MAKKCPRLALFNILMLLGLSMMTKPIEAKHCDRRDFRFFSVGDDEEAEPEEDQSSEEDARPDDGPPSDENLPPEEDPPTDDGQTVELPDDCGHYIGSLSKQRIKISHPRIFNGYDAKLGQFPSYVELMLPQKDSVVYNGCGGTIITSRHVLTAGHCISEDIDIETAKVGSGLKKFNKGIKDLEKDVEKICKSSRFHQEQDPNSQEPFTIYDVAIIKLKDDIEFTDTIKPACLPESANPMTINQQGYSIGLGLKYKNPSNNLTILGDSLKVLPVLKTDCPPSDQHESVMCHKANRPDHLGLVCMGDSGGPVIALNGEGRQTIYGIHSYGDVACMKFPEGSEYKYINRNTDVHNIRSEIDALLEECA